MAAGDPPAGRAPDPSTGDDGGGRASARREPRGPPRPAGAPPAPRRGRCDGGGCPLRAFAGPGHGPAPADLRQALGGHDRDRRGGRTAGPEPPAAVRRARRKRPHGGAGARRVRLSAGRGLHRNPCGGGDPLAGGSRVRRALRGPRRGTSAHHPHGHRRIGVGGRPRAPRGRTPRGRGAVRPALPKKRVRRRPRGPARPEDAVVRQARLPGGAGPLLPHPRHAGERRAPGARGHGHRPARHGKPPSRGCARPRPRARRDREFALGPAAAGGHVSAHGVPARRRGRAHRRTRRGARQGGRLLRGRGPPRQRGSAPAPRTPSHPGPRRGHRCDRDRHVPADLDPRGGASPEPPRLLSSRRSLPYDSSRFPKPHETPRRRFRLHAHRAPDRDRDHRRDRRGSRSPSCSAPGSRPTRRRSSATRAP